MYKREHTSKRVQADTLSPSFWLSEAPNSVYRNTSMCVSIQVTFVRQILDYRGGWNEEDERSRYVGQSSTWVRLLSVCGCLGIRAPPVFSYHWAELTQFWMRCNCDGSTLSSLIFFSLFFFRAAPEVLISSVIGMDDHSHLVIHTKCECLTHKVRIVWAFHPTQRHGMLLWPWHCWMRCPSARYGRSCPSTGTHAKRRHECLLRLLLSPQKSAPALHHQ